MSNAPLDPATRPPGFGVAAVGRLAIVVFDRTPSAHDAQAMGALLVEVARTHPTLNILSVVGTSCGVPSAEVREQLMRDVKAVQRYIGAVATVIEGAGFRGAAVRGAVTGMTVVLRPSYPVKTFATVLEAAEFLSRSAGCSAGEVTLGVSRLRAPR